MQPSFSIRILNFALGFCWWGAIASSILLPIFLVAAFSMSDTSKAEISYTGYASEIDASGLSVFNRDGKEGRVDFENGTLLKFSFPIETKEEKVKMVFMVVLGSLVVIAFFLALIKQLREILKTVSAGDPFVEANAKRLRWVGLILVFATFAQAFGMFAVSGYADALFVPEGFNLNGHIDLDFLQLIAGLCVLVLSEVFCQGAKMREEQSLTV